MEFATVDRNPGRWGLDEKAVERRRQLFWELYFTNLLRVSRRTPHPGRAV